jgi:hypothetical protein
MVTRGGVGARLLGYFPFTQASNQLPFHPINRLRPYMFGKWRDVSLLQLLALIDGYPAEQNRKPLSFVYTADPSRNIKNFDGIARLR